MPSRSISFFVAGTGPMPMIRGGTAADASPRMRARGVSPCFFTAASEAKIIAAAPSLTPEALPAVRKLLERLGLKIGDIDLIELNEAFASQGIAVLRQLGVTEDADFVNPHGGAIALGHPLGMSGARLALTAVHGMEKRGGKLALATMCVGVGQGVAVAIEKLN
jgi:acetyl-CoA acetyltransferase